MATEQPGGPNRSTPGADARPTPGDRNSSLVRQAARPAALPTPICSERLLAGASEIQIVHRGTLYRLRQTALGKLILTK